MSNLRSRLRLQQKAIEIKLKEKKKETATSSTRNAKGQPVVAPSKAKILEPVRNTVSRDASINKQRRLYRPATAIPKGKTDKPDIPLPKPEGAKVAPPKPSVQQNLIPRRSSIAAKSPLKRRNDKLTKALPMEPAKTFSVKSMGVDAQSKVSATTSLPKISTHSSGGKSSVK